MQHPKTSPLIVFRRNAWIDIGFRSRFPDIVRGSIGVVPTSLYPNLY